MATMKTAFIITIVQGETRYIILLKNEVLHYSKSIMIIKIERGRAYPLLRMPLCKRAADN